MAVRIVEQPSSGKAKAADVLQNGLRGLGSLSDDEAQWAELAQEGTEKLVVKVSISADANAQAEQRGEIVFTQRFGRLLVGRLVVQIEIGS